MTIEAQALELHSEAAHRDVALPAAQRPGNVRTSMSVGGRQRALGRRDLSRREGTPTAPPTSIVPADYPPASERELEAQEPTPNRRQRAAVRRHESLAFTAHLGAEPTLAPPVAPAPETPDPSPERARIERELGIEARAFCLARYGIPPVAPPAERTDREQLERTLLGDLSRWHVGARRSVRTEIREQAVLQAQAEDERHIAERQQLQKDLDERWVELRDLRACAERRVGEWVDSETRRRDAARAEQQAALDAEWQSRVDADPESVTAALRAAVDDFAGVLGYLGGVAVMVVDCPSRDDMIADSGLIYGTAGPAFTRPRSEAERNRLYLSAIASRVLAAVGRVLSATPAVDAVICVAVRVRDDATAFLREPVYVGTFRRAYAERLAAEGRWTAHPDTLRDTLKEAEEVKLNVDDRTQEIVELSLDDDPSLRAVIRQMDPAVRAGESAEGTSDRNAVSLLLMDRGDREHNAADDRRGSKVTDFQSDTDTSLLQSDRDNAGHQPSGGADATSGVTLPQLTSEDPEPPQEAASVGEPGAPKEQSAGDKRLSSEESWGEAAATRKDPLLDALHDADGSVRRAAVEGISRRNDPNDTPLLLSALGDQDQIVRLEAVYALKDRLSPDMRRDALVEASGEGDEVGRRKAIEALADLGDQRDTPVLVKALQDPDDSIRLEAIYAIGQRLTPDVHDGLIAACSDTNARVRQKAVAAMAELGDDRDTPLLLKTLQDSDSSVRFEAMNALKARSAVGSRDQLSEPLLAAMKSEDAIVRQAAVKLLIRAEHP
jgi:HEAT repeat protein